MDTQEILSKLRDCVDCGNDDVKWCSISHRPYCDCGNWGRTNSGSDQDAIDSWNEKTEHEKYLELKASLPKLKADAIREAAEETVEDFRVCDNEGRVLYIIHNGVCDVNKLNAYADKVERDKS